MDWYSRCVLAWRVSNSMDTVFCVDCLQEALDRHAKPKLFNTEQGSQFTRDAFTGVLNEAGIAISMDGRGRAVANIFVERLWRNVKYEDVYLKGYGTVAELTLGLTGYFAFYNGDTISPPESIERIKPLARADDKVTRLAARVFRPHQALNNWTPSEVYVAGIGGGTSIAYSGSLQRGPSTLATTGQRRSAAIEELDAA